MLIKEKWLEFSYKQKCKNKKIIIFKENTWGNSFVADSPDVLNVYDECKGYGFYHKRLDIKDAIIAKVFRKQNNVAFILITKFEGRALSVIISQEFITDFINYLSTSKRKKFNQQRINFVKTRLEELLKCEQATA